jgi:hypothetical protein
MCNWNSHAFSISVKAYCVSVRKCFCTLFMWYQVSSLKSIRIISQKIPFCLGNKRKLQTRHFTNQPPWSRVLLEKLIVPKIVKTLTEFFGEQKVSLFPQQPILSANQEIDEFYVIQKFIVYTPFRNVSLFWARVIQSVTCHPIHLRPILILSRLHA